MGKEKVTGVEMLAERGICDTNWDYIFKKCLYG